MRPLHIFTIAFISASASLFACASPTSPTSESSDHHETLGTEQSAIAASSGGPGGDPTVPVPPRPPTPTASAAGFYDIATARLELELAAALALPAIRHSIEESGYSVSVTLAEHPWDCGYHCENAPEMYYTKYTDRPNDWYAYWDGQLHFVASAYGATRDIYLTIPYRFYCNGWQQLGGGTMAGYRLATRTYVEGTGNLEQALDFLLGPVNLTRFVDEKFQENLAGSGGRSTIAFTSPTRCSSLGTLDYYPNDGAALSDKILWDVPPRGSVIIGGGGVVRR